MSVYVYYVALVRPVGKFSRKSLAAIPATWKLHQMKNYYPRSHADAAKIRDKYNTTAKRCGWGTWAILVVDRAYLETAAHAEAINVWLNKWSKHIDPHGQFSLYRVRLTPSIGETHLNVSAPSVPSFAIPAGSALTMRNVLEFMRLCINKIEQVSQRHPIKPKPIPVASDALLVDIHWDRHRDRVEPAQQKRGAA